MLTVKNAIFASVILSALFGCGGGTSEAPDSPATTTPSASTDVTDVTVIDITDDSATVAWQGSSEATVWVEVKSNNTIGPRHEASGNIYTFTRLGSNMNFVIKVQGKGSTKISSFAFKTKIELDTTAPVITLLGDSSTTVSQNNVYTDAGATANDNKDGNISNNIVVNNLVDTATVGSYTVTYNVKDASNNSATEVTRTVIVTPTVIDKTAPVITLLGNLSTTVRQNSVYTDAGATANDNKDGNISNNIVVNNPVNTATVGTYTVTYNVSDNANNTATQMSRVVEVIAVPPSASTDVTDVKVIDITDGSATVTWQGSSQATVWIEVKSNNTIGPRHEASGNKYNFTRLGSNMNFVVKIQGKGSTKISSFAFKTKIEIDTTAPVITLLGDSSTTVVQNSVYTDAGATANDNKDGNISNKIVVNNPVNTATVGSYTVTYNIKDLSNNSATEVTRTVTVIRKSTTSHYQNPKSTDVAQLEGDLTNWGADESQMDKGLMEDENNIITAYPTTVTGREYRPVTNKNDFPTDATSGDVIKLKVGGDNGIKIDVKYKNPDYDKDTNPLVPIILTKEYTIGYHDYIFSGLQHKWVRGYKLNIKNMDETAYYYSLSKSEPKFGTTSSGAYTQNWHYQLPTQDIASYIIENGGGTLYLPKGEYQNQLLFNASNNPGNLRNFRIIGDGKDETIIDAQYTDKPAEYITSYNPAISITPSSGDIQNIENIIISDMRIVTTRTALDINASSVSIGDNLLLRNIKIVREVSASSASLLSFNRGLFMNLTRVTLDNVHTSTSSKNGYGNVHPMHELAFPKGKYLKIHDSTFNAEPDNFNVDTHAQFIEISNSKLIKTGETGNPNMKFPGSNYLLFNKVHFKSKSTNQGNILVSSSPEKYNLHFENCVFETASPAVFTTYGHIGYGVKQLVLKDNVIDGPGEFQIYGADKVYMKGNKKSTGESIDIIKPYTFDAYSSLGYQTPSADFLPLNKIQTPITSGEPIDASMGYKSWNTNNTDKVISNFSLLDQSISINKDNIETATDLVELESLINSMNSSAQGGLIKIVEGSTIAASNLVLNKTGIIGKGKLIVDNITVNDEGYIGEGLLLTVNDKITVNGSLLLTTATIKKPNGTGGNLIKGNSSDARIIIRATNLSGGENIIAGEAEFIIINGESKFSDYEKSAINAKALFLNITNTSIEKGNYSAGEYGIYVDDVTNLYLNKVFVKDIQKPVYLSYHANTKVIDINELNTTVDNPITTSASFDSDLIDISIGTIKKNGNDIAPSLYTPSAQYAYAYNGVILTPAAGKTHGHLKNDPAGGNTYSYHLPIGYFPAEWNYLNPNASLRFSRP